jgi:hypothetical protein
MNPAAWIPAALVVLLVANTQAAAQATSTTVSADGLSLAQGAWHATPALASFQDKVGVDGMTITIQATSLEATVMHDSGYGGAVAGQGLPATTRLDRTLGAHSGDENWSLTQVVGQLQASGGAQIHVRGPVVFDGTGETVAATGIIAPRLGPDGIVSGGVSPNQFPVLSTDDGNDATWSTWSQPGAWVRVDAGAGSYTLTGDIELEMTGLAGLLHTGASAQMLDTANSRVAMTGGVFQEHVGFARITLHDARVTVHVGPGAQATTVAQTATGSGADATMIRATGIVVEDGNTVQVNNEDVVLDGPESFELTANNGVVGIRTQALGADGQPIHLASSAVELPSSLTSAALAASAVVAMGSGATVLYVRRARRLPTMADVEALLEAGAFRRAARESLAILKRNPSSEDAFVSRLVALSRAGRHERVVQEANERLARRAPSDGVQHYVLGLSYRSLGLTRQADAALAEAARLTPSLKADAPSGEALLSLSHHEANPGGYA